jgi:tyrosyl-tRNA synthetase
MASEFKSEFESGLTRDAIDLKAALISSFAEEIVNEDKLKSLLQKNAHPIAYDGFEPSGRMHIAQGIIRTTNTNRLTDSGCTFIFWVADYFAKLNNKMDNDMEKIRNAGKLMIETWKLCGMNMENVEFLWTSKEISSRSDEYRELVLDIASKFSLSRIQRCCQAMGRTDKDDLTAAQIFYPCMQCADIFFLNVDICSLGLDQRKVNMLANEYCDKTQYKKPVILSHHMIMGLDGSDKMAKSNPNNAIFMDDTPADVKRKIKKAICPPNIIDKNPIMEYFKYIVFEHPATQNSIIIRRKPEYGGDKTYYSYRVLETAYITGDVHPGDLKNCLIECINIILHPIQKALAEDEDFAELSRLVRSYNVKPSGKKEKKK